MDWDLLIETMNRLPAASIAMIAGMAFIGAILISQILKVGVYTTAISMPLLLLAGVLGNALLLINHIILSPDRASNVALSATLGFIVFVAMCFGVVRAWSAIQDRH